MKKNNFICDLRKSLYFSQNNFAKAVGVSRISVANWEQGVKNPSIDHAYRILKIAEESGIEATLNDIFPRKN